MLTIPYIIHIVAALLLYDAQTRQRLTYDDSHFAMPSPS